MNRQRKPKILFTSPCIPYPKAAVLKDNIDFFYYRNTCGQGLFTLKQVHSWHPLHYLAQNAAVPSVVLENPTLKQLIRELHRGAYDIVAISFTVVTACTVWEMVSRIKAEYPHTTVLLGGYGTVIFSQNYGLETRLAALADGICTGEGVGFLHRYLQEHWGVVPPARRRQALLPTRNYFFRSRLLLFRQLNFIHALGCRNCCTFCATSLQYSGKQLILASAEELVEAMSRALKKHPSIHSAIIYNENFLANRDFTARFKKALQRNPSLAASPLLLTVFSSLRALAGYTVRELLELKIGTLYVGVESFRPEILADEGLVKRGWEESTDISGEFERLHNAGINTIASMVIGWDGHTPANVETEIENFVRLNPAFYQVIPLHPIPGTPLWEQIKASGRIIDNYNYENDGISIPNFHYKNFTAEEIRKLVDSTYRRLAARGGPGPFRLLEILTRGISNLESETDPLYTRRIRLYRKMLRPLLPLALLSRLFFRGKGFRVRWLRVTGRLLKEFPLHFYTAILLALLYLPLLLLVYVLASLFHWCKPSGDQPPALRREYP